MPNAARSGADNFVLFRADWITDAVRSHISTGLCSTQPALGRICSCSSWWRPTSAPSWSKIMHLVLVVPWSMAATNSAGMPSSWTTRSGAGLVHVVRLVGCAPLWAAFDSAAEPGAADHTTFVREIFAAPPQSVDLRGPGFGDDG